MSLTSNRSSTTLGAIATGLGVAAVAFAGGWLLRGRKGSKLTSTTTIATTTASSPVSLVERKVVLAARPPKRIFLFDVDGTLTSAARKPTTPEMNAFLDELRSKALVGIVGGSDLVKQKEQLGEHFVSHMDYVFSENGLVAFKNGISLANQSIAAFLGETKLKAFIRFVLHYIADLDIPVKRGTFIEFRAGMLNISPIGRNCSQSERDDFGRYDLEHNIRPTMIEALKRQFPEYGLTYSIGGQISFDVFPNGWDKTYCLQYLAKDDVDEIHFFGDKTMKGGNDYEIFSHASVVGHSVTGPEDTIRQVNEVLAKPPRSS